MSADLCVTQGETDLKPAGKGEQIATNGNGVRASELLPPDEVIFGQTPAMRSVRVRLQKVLGTAVPVLLEGDGGTGKELIARWIHANSPWRDKPFVKVNCAAIPGTLLESELFGFEKGAFTGAVHSKPGRVENAQGGTLFLDEIPEIEWGLQAKLLQFLQDGRFSRIGDPEERCAETHLICATNKNLEEEIESARFRRDLFYRINVVRIKLPPLRERREDIPTLIEHFRTHYAKKFGVEREPLGSDLLTYLKAAAWPGNIRELSNYIARYVLIGADTAPVDTPQSRRDKGADNGHTQGPASLKRIAREAVLEVERNVILQALQQNQWNRRRTATALNISYRALMYKIRGANLVQRKAASSQNDWTSPTKNPLQRE